MNAGIIAAGQGSRLRGARPDLPKPLFPVAGHPLIHWVVLGLRAAGARSITLLLNSSGDAVRSYLERQSHGVDWTFLRRDTASSWESFRLVSRTLARDEERFLISTVDALVPPGETARFARESAAPPAMDAALALTRFVDDEKPLWTDLEADGRVSALGARAVRKDAVTCGLYALTRAAAAAMPAAAAYGRLRDYWSGLIEGGRPVRGVLLSDTVDMDRAEDLPAAERMASCFDA